MENTIIFLMITQLNDVEPEKAFIVMGYFWNYIFHCNSNFQVFDESYLTTTKSKLVIMKDSF